MASARLPHSSLDCLLLAFDDAKLSVIAYDAARHDVVTVSLHSFEEPSLRCGYTKQLQEPMVRSVAADEHVAGGRRSRVAVRGHTRLRAALGRPPAHGQRRDGRRSLHERRSCVLSSWLIFSQTHLQHRSTCTRT